MANALIMSSRFNSVASGGLKVESLTGSVSLAPLHSATNIMKLGIYGGTFDPVHNAHLLVAQAAIEELKLDRLFFVPTARSPFKLDYQPAPDLARLQFLRLALAGKTNCEVDDQEIRRGGISYTVETLRNFAKRFPGARMFYLLGADNAAKLAEWMEPGELARLAEFVVVPRPDGGEARFQPPFCGRILSGFPFGVSSSQIRARIKAGLPVDTLVPTAVAEAIGKANPYL